ncbi:MAG: serpin family protein [Prevotella sp.]|nr:serpin family protein [Prevotella sp.]
MKRYMSILCTIALFSAISINAIAEDNTRIPMLEQGKAWTYILHHFDYDGERYKETTTAVFYQLEGDTVINGRQYMKMYRRINKINSKSYYGAFREDEEGRVWQYDYWGDQKDFMICDITCEDYPNYIFDPDKETKTVSDILYVKGKKFHRYMRGEFIGVEGVGFEWKGLIYHLEDDLPTCVCDYEVFEKVVAKGFQFFNSDFFGPHSIELTQDEKQLVEQNNDFAFNLFRKTRTGASQIISPLSITYSLGMLNNGAAGQTQQEILQVLGFKDVAALNEFCLKMQNEFLTSRLVDGTKALLSNTIFVNQGLGWQLQDGFINKAKDYYFALPENRDFNDGRTLGAINQWASDHTDGMIQEVLNESDFDPSAVSYLLNALYFKGLWSNPFDAEMTQEEIFEGGNTVLMMQDTWFDLKYAENELYQMVWLPYGNKTYQMEIILPRKGKTLDEVVEYLNGTNWQLEGQPTMVSVKLPRFETSTEIDLRDIMSTLGMPSVFSCEDADLSNLCMDNNGENLFISNMKQVAKIKLNEQGTIAAAVTIDLITGSDGSKPVEFYANHPFLYVISERSTGIILFIGQYMGETTTKIITPSKTNNDDHTIYNLAGQRLNRLQKGLNIVNGRKVFVK